jgi:hypothetical protein
MGAWLSIGCLALAIIFGIALTNHNLKMLRENKQERLEARRAYKKRKNRALAKFYGITLREDNDKCE